MWSDGMSTSNLQLIPWPHGCPSYFPLIFKVNVTMYVNNCLTWLSLNRLTSKGCCVFLALVSDDLNGHGRLHVPDTSLYWYNVHIRVSSRVGDFLRRSYSLFHMSMKWFHLDEHLVSFVVPVVTKEPSSVHVETPGSLVTNDKVTKVVFFTNVHSSKVLHQHVIHMLGSEVLNSK